MIGSEDISGLFAGAYAATIGAVLHIAYRLRKKRRWAKWIIDAVLTLSFHSDRVIPYGVALCYVMGAFFLIWAAIELVRSST